MLRLTQHIILNDAGGKTSILHLLLGEINQCDPLKIYIFHEKKPKKENHDYKMSFMILIFAIF